jgi:hypothetical protein
MRFANGRRLCFSARVRRTFMFVAVLACAVLPEGRSLAGEPSSQRAPGPRALAGPTLEELTEQIARLEARHGAEEVAGRALAHARTAVERARALQARGQTRPADRARQIAAAAVLLAQRRVALAAERAAHRGALARLERARRRAAAAEEALRHATDRRERILEGPDPAPPEDAQ